MFIHPLAKFLKDFVWQDQKLLTVLARLLVLSICVKRSGQRLLVLH